ncbi:uncharacterized protein V6R79_004989 [Siganus canaliculatus]
MKPGPSNRAQSADVSTQKREEAAMTVRALENSLEKTQFKCKEAENIMINYQKLKSQLQEESLTFEGQLDCLETEIRKHREELHDMQTMNNKAQLSKEAAKAELQQQEELLYKERKERECIIAGYRRKVEERKIQAEKAERRAQRTAIQPDELSSEAQRSTPRMAGEEEKVISTFQEAFRRIKEATGVADIQEIVDRFTSQRETQEHLENLKEENEKVLQQLKEQKSLLSQQFQDMKYSGEAKLSSDQRTLVESEQQLQAHQQRCEASEKHLDWLIKTLSAVRAGVEHLADKLQHITVVNATSLVITVTYLTKGPFTFNVFPPQSGKAVAEVSPDSDEFVLVLMTLCEMKLQLLHEELQGKDLVAIMKEMEEEEFYVRIEGKLPAFNTRVKLPEDLRPDAFSDEEESEEDDADFLSREALKRQSQLIVDSRSKKKSWKKKS